MTGLNILITPPQAAAAKHGNEPRHAGMTGLNILITPPQAAGAK